jgi:hypothetical protein
MVAIVATAILICVFTGFEALLNLVLIHKLRSKHRPQLAMAFHAWPG